MIELIHHTRHKNPEPGHVTCIEIADAVLAALTPADPSGAKEPKP